MDDEKSVNWYGLMMHGLISATSKGLPAHADATRPSRTHSIISKLY